jgi:serine/threonine protein kinase
MQQMKAGPVPERMIGLITFDVVNALHYLHTTGIIHRDIKGRYLQQLALALTYNI